MGTITLPKGWDQNSITMGQVNSVAFATAASATDAGAVKVNGSYYIITDPVYAYETAPVAQGGMGLTQSANPLDSYFAYFGLGNAVETQFSLLPLNNITTGKITLPIVVAAEHISNPEFVIYSSDWSTKGDSGAVAVAQTIGELDKATISSISKQVASVDQSGNPTTVTVKTYTVTENASGAAINSHNTNSAVMELANLALQSAGFNEQAVKAGLASGAATILFNPDGIAEMAKNMDASSGVTVNSSAGYTNIDGTIYAAGATYNNIATAITLNGVSIDKGSTIIVNPTNISWSNILNNAITAIYSDPNYSTMLPSKQQVLGDAQGLLKTLSDAGVQNNIKAYLPIESFLVHEFAPNCSVTTNGSIWSAVGPNIKSTQLINSANWDVNSAAQYLIDNYNSLGWQTAQKYLSFMTYDRWERDDLSGIITTGASAYAYTPEGWANTISTYVKATQGYTDAAGVYHQGLMSSSNNGIQLWQIPSGSLPTSSTSDASLVGMGVSTKSGGSLVPAAAPSIDQFHAGIEQYYFFGQKGIGSSNANYGILNSSSSYNVADTPLLNVWDPATKTYKQISYG